MYNSPQRTDCVHKIALILIISTSSDQCTPVHAGMWPPLWQNVARFYDLKGIQDYLNFEVVTKTYLCYFQDLLGSSY